MESDEYEKRSIDFYYFNKRMKEAGYDIMKSYLSIETINKDELAVDLNLFFEKFYTYCGKLQSFILNLNLNKKYEYTKNKIMIFNDNIELISELFEKYSDIDKNKIKEWFEMFNLDNLKDEYNDKHIISFLFNKVNIRNNFVHHFNSIIFNNDCIEIVVQQDKKYQIIFDNIGEKQTKDKLYIKTFKQLIDSILDYSEKLLFNAREVKKIIIEHNKTHFIENNIYLYFTFKKDGKYYQQQFECDYIRTGDIIDVKIIDSRIKDNKNIRIIKQYYSIDEFKCINDFKENNIYEKNKFKYVKSDVINVTEHKCIDDNDLIKFLNIMNIIKYYSLTEYIFITDKLNNKEDLSTISIDMLNNLIEFKINLINITKSNYDIDIFKEEIKYLIDNNRITLIKIDTFKILCNQKYITDYIEKLFDILIKHKYCNYTISFNYIYELYKIKNNIFEDLDFKYLNEFIIFIDSKINSKTNNVKCENITQFESINKHIELNINNLKYIIKPICEIYYIHYKRLMESKDEKDNIQCDLLNKSYTLKHFIEHHIKINKCINNFQLIEELNDKDKYLNMFSQIYDIYYDKRNYLEKITKDKMEFKHKMNYMYFLCKYLININKTIIEHKTNNIYIKYKTLKEILYKFYDNFKEMIDNKEFNLDEDSEIKDFYYHLENSCGSLKKNNQ
jgi:hypothetical protein